MIIELLLKGLLIGVILGVPAGAIGAMTIRRTIDRGVCGGLVSGAGSCVADLFFAIIGVFGVTIISDFLTEYESIIEVIGGLLIVFIGLVIISGKQKQREYRSGDNLLVFFLTSMGAALLNPGTMVAFMVAFTSFEVTNLNGIHEDIILILGIITGTFIWWIILVTVVMCFRSKLKEEHYRRINIVLGSLVGLFGIAICIKGILSLCNVTR